MTLVERFLAEVLPALVDAAEAERSGIAAPELAAFGGMVRGVDSSGRLVTLECGEVGTYLRDGAPVLMRAGGWTLPAEVVCHHADRGELVCAIDEALPEEARAVSVEPLGTALLDRMVDALRELPRAGDERLERAVRFLLGQAAAAPFQAAGPPSLSASQRLAMGAALEREVTYVWGPPGTGKTVVAAHAIAELRRRGESVLLTAQTNAALDHTLSVLERAAPRVDDVLRWRRGGDLGPGAPRLVAATLAALHGPGLGSLDVDAVIIDEASMASVPLCLLAAAKARRRVIAFGDGRQLPAIVQSEEPAAVHWLGRSVFETARIDDLSRPHPLAVLLAEQWRMHPQICQVVSDSFYGGLLRTAPERAPAEAGPAVLLLDTSSRGAYSQKTASGSKQNPEHAEIVADLVEVSSGPIAVIAPYRAQAALVRQTLARRCPMRAPQVEVATVHRFQGSDAPTVIFDLTEGPGTEPRSFDELRGHDPRQRLTNVALSRARDRLVIVAHLAHLTETLGYQSFVQGVFGAVRRAGGLELDAANPADRAAIEDFMRNLPR